LGRLLKNHHFLNQTLTNKHNPTSQNNNQTKTGEEREKQTQIKIMMDVISQYSIFNQTKNPNPLVTQNQPKNKVLFTGEIKHNPEITLGSYIGKKN